MVAGGKRRELNEWRTRARRGGMHLCRHYIIVLPHTSVRSVCARTHVAIELFTNHLKRKTNTQHAVNQGERCGFPIRILAGIFTLESRNPLQSVPVGGRPLMLVR